MELQFNVIFIPHSVKYLQYGVLSLLRFSDYRFRLIANGLGAVEYRILENLVANNERLSLCGKPGGKLQPHGDMLNTLLKQAEGDRFCFMDNDIFAVGPFQSQIQEHIGQCDVISSGCGLSSRSGSNVPGSYMGGAPQTPGGLPVAITHLSIYPTLKLKELVAETGVGFEHIAPQVSLPSIARQPDFPEDLSEVHKMDTGILMNMLAGMRGWTFRKIDIPGLVHIGNISASMQRHQKWTKRLRSFFRGESRQKVFILHDRDMNQELNDRIARRKYRHGEKKSIGADQETTYVQKKIMRNRIATYYRRLFIALVDGGAIPRIELPQSERADRIRQMSEILAEVVGETRST